MTREEFIEILRKKRYSYKMEGDKIVITHSGWIDLNGLKTLAPGVHFKNKGSVDLVSLETLAPGVHFENGGDVYLKELEWVEDNKGIRIEGVGNRRLLNLMISKGLFI